MTKSEYSSISWRFRKVVSSRNFLFCVGTSLGVWFCVPKTIPKTINYKFSSSFRLSPWFTSPFFFRNNINGKTPSCPRNERSGTGPFECDLSPVLYRRSPSTDTLGRGVSAGAHCGRSTFTTWRVKGVSRRSWPPCEEFLLRLRKAKINKIYNIWCISVSIYDYVIIEKKRNCSKLPSCRVYARTCGLVVGVLDVFLVL